MRWLIALFADLYVGLKLGRCKCPNPFTTMSYPPSCVDCGRTREKRDDRIDAYRAGLDDIAE